MRDRVDVRRSATAAHVDEADAARRISTTSDGLVQDHLETVYALIYSHVGNREEAEELTTRVFMAASRQIEWRDPRDMRAVLVGLAHAVVADYWRAFFSSSFAVIEDGALASGRPRLPRAAAASSLSPAQRAEHILRRLPERERAVLTYRLLQSRSARETAQAMRLSEKGVKELLYRALTMAAELDPGGWRPQ